MRRRIAGTNNLCSALQSTIASRLAATGFVCTANPCGSQPAGDGVICTTKKLDVPTSRPSAGTGRFCPIDDQYIKVQYGITSTKKAFIRSSSFFYLAKPTTTARKRT
jgi:hypothetical protein